MMISVSRGVDDIFTGGTSFIDDVGGNYVDGLMSCTESLGFESSDERRAVEDRIIHESLNRIDEELCSRKAKKEEVKIKKEVKFPPPLSSLGQDGRPTFFLRPVRGDGRLMLTEVKIVRPEILRASRQDGRLKLHLVQDFEDETEEDDVDDDEEEIQMQDNEAYIQEEEETKENLTNEELVGENEEGWQFSGTTTSGGGDGLRRCHEQVSHHQHVWRQHCLTIR